LDEKIVNVNVLVDIRQLDQLVFNTVGIHAYLASIKSTHSKFLVNALIDITKIKLVWNLELFIELKGRSTYNDLFYDKRVLIHAESKN
jgi:hypothetical protein